MFAGIIRLADKSLQPIVLRLGQLGEDRFAVALMAGGVRTVLGRSPACGIRTMAHRIIPTPVELPGLLRPRTVRTPPLTHYTFSAALFVRSRRLVKPNRIWFDGNRFSFHLLLNRF